MLKKHTELKEDREVEKLRNKTYVLDYPEFHYKIQGLIDFNQTYYYSF